MTHFLKTVSVCSVADVRRLLIAAGHDFIVPDHRVKSSGFESGNAQSTGKNRNCSSRARAAAVIGLRYRTTHLRKVYRINRLTLQCFTQDSPGGRKRCDGQTHTAPKSPYTHGTRLDVFAFDKASVCSPCVKRLHGFARRGERTCCPGRRVSEAASPCLATGVPVQSVSQSAAGPGHHHDEQGVVPRDMFIPRSIATRSSSSRPGRYARAFSQCTVELFNVPCGEKKRKKGGCGVEEEWRRQR